MLRDSDEVRLEVDIAGRDVTVLLCAYQAQTKIPKIIGLSVREGFGSSSQFKAQNIAVPRAMTSW